MRRLGLWAVALFALVPTADAVSPAAVPMRFTGAQEVWWAGRHYWDRRREVKLKEIAKGPKAYDAVFFGGTLMQNWEGWCEKDDVEKVGRLYSEGRLGYPNGPGRAVWDEMSKRYRLLNVAMAGDTTQHALWRLQNGAMEGYVTQCVVMMPDWANEDSPEDIADGVKAMLERIAEYQPQAVTLLMPILPRGERKDDPQRLRVERINKLIQAFVDDRHVVWCDIRDRFLKPDGGIRRDLMPDGCHPLGKGYGVWRDALTPYFENLCKRDNKPTKGKKR